MNTSYTLQSGQFCRPILLTGVIGFIFAFSFLLSPKEVHAEFCLGDVDPKSYIENYLKKQQQDTTVDITKLATKLLGIEVLESVSLSDAIGTVYSSNKAALCFQDKEYWKGFKILGETATKISLDIVAKAITGYSPVTWPAAVVDVGLNILRNKIDETAINNIVSNYNLALAPDWCETSIDQCHQRIVECSELSISTHNPWVCFLEDGYQFYNGWLTYPTLSSQNFVNPDISREKFYASAKAIYQEKRTAEQIIQQNERAAAGLIDSALKTIKDKPETAVANNGDGFLAGLWQTFSDSVKNAATSIKEFFASPKETEIKPSNLFGQISSAIPANTDKKETAVPAQQINPSDQQDQLRQAEEAKKKQVEEEQKSKIVPCVTSGCSNDACVPQGENVITTCDINPEKSCLREAARCERQPDGRCGWTREPQYPVCVERVKKEGEQRRKIIEADHQKQEDQRKIEELRRAQTVAEDALKKAKTADEQRIAKEARKKAEEARIAAEQEAQKHQQEEALRRAQEEQRQAQAAAEEAKRKEQQANTVALPLPSPNPTPVPNPIPTTPSTQIPPTPSISSTPKSNFITLTKSKVVDQFGTPFEYIDITCQREDGSSCNAQSDFGSYIRFGPISDRDKPFLNGKYIFTIQGSQQGATASNATIKTITIAHADGSVIDIGEVTLKRWGHILVSPIDEVGNLRAVYWELEGVFDDDLCDTNRLWGMKNYLNMDYYCSNEGSFYNYNTTVRVPSSYFGKYPLPDGQYILKAFDSLYSSTEALYKTTVRISQGQDVNLGTIEIKP
ncbi:MAG: hypothetical protein ABH810_01710 [bacterium]